VKGKGKMKKRMFFALALVSALLLAGGVTYVLAEAPPKVTGGVVFPVPQWGDLRIWLRFSVHEVDPVIHAAEGQVNVQIYSPYEGWRRWEGVPVCVKAGGDEAGGTAVMVIKITSKSGWGDGEPGEHAKFWVRDGGTPASEGDQWMTQSYQWEPEWKEFWPKDVPPPDCESITLDESPIDIEGGNLVIH
jgi:hypothetical protein